jgi:acyl-CoA reductase-like NAD-dependent aldehyde dehydrogenase
MATTVRHASTLASINPATGDTVAEFEEHSVDEVERRLSASVDAFREWSGRAPPPRARGG